MRGVTRSTTQSIQLASLSISDESFSCPLELEKKELNKEIESMEASTSLFSMVKFLI